MGLLSTEVEVVLSGSNIRYYENLGYQIPKGQNKPSITVPIKDLSPHSKIYIDVECDCCHKKYKSHYDNYNRYLHDDGSIYCRTCACKLFKSGENHYKWNPNKTDEERLMKRVGSEYDNFIRIVFKRDNYTCQCCGQYSGNLKAHHLDGFNWCIEKRTDPNNGITLCETCHNNFHSIYGKGDNTKEQFEEWLGKTINLLEQNIILPSARQIYCIEENKIYFSATELANQWNMRGTAPIYNVCNHLKTVNKEKTKDGKIVNRQVGNYTVNGKHLLWYDEYINMTDEELMKYMAVNKYVPYTRKVICITTGQVFDSILSAQCYYNAKLNISYCCRGRQKSAGKLEDGTPLVWMYYEDYLCQQNNTTQITD